MSNETQNSTESTAPIINDLSNDNISFSDYQKIRRGESVSNEQKAAPVEKPIEQKLATESETVETEDESQDDESEDNYDELNKPKKKGGFQRRIDKLNARYSAAQAEIDHWKKQALNGAGEPKKESVEKSQPVAVEGKPIADNFETHAEYVEALTEWKIDQREKSSKELAQKSQLQAEQDKVLKSHYDREKSFAEKNDDYKSVISELMESNPKISASFEQLIVTSDNGPEIMYMLAKDVKEFERLNTLSPMAAAREIGKIESKLALNSSEEKKLEPKKITTAPKPIEPVSKGSAASTRKSIDDPDLPFADYERIRREQKKKR